MDLFTDELTGLRALELVAVLGVLAVCVWEGARSQPRWRIANRITVPAIVGAAAAAPLVWEAWSAHLLAGAAAFGVFVAASLAWPAVLGMGPAKLVAPVGFVLGPAVAVAAALAVLTATLDAYAGRTAGRVAGAAPHLLAATSLVVAAACVT